MDTIVVLDYGGQYAHLIANRLRRLGVYSEIRPPEAEIGEVKGVILSGGPNSVYDKSSPKIHNKLLEKGIPVLGLCYGHQLIAHELGGKVKPGKTREYGRTEIEVESEGIFKGMGKKQLVWMSHGDSVKELPPGFKVLAKSSDCPVVAMGNPEKKLYGMQFHPEVTHTERGTEMLENFIEICDCKKDWDAGSYTKQLIGDIKKKAGNKKVFMLVSGGVDSTVAFALLNRALGTKNVYGLFIDNGFVRKNEVRMTKERMEKQGFVNFRMIDASSDFLDAEKNVYDPEEKRKIIGEVFIKVQQKELDNIGLNAEEWMLGQGTIYPDTIETGRTKHAEVIKTHHNRVKIIEELIEQGKVIEPLEMLYKDEVRAVGEELGLPKELVWRHPFPGPGLAVRCLCAKEAASMESRKLDEIAARYNLKAKVLPIKSVGVQGDFRTYGHPAVLIGEADWDTLEKASTEITNRIKDINRVVWLMGPKELPDVGVKAGYLTKERLDLLREADYRAMKNLRSEGMYNDVWQMPVVLIPVSIKGGESIVLRPVSSKEAMTASFSKLPVGFVRDVANKILQIEGVDAVFYDITNKPPGTIEWE